MRSMTGFGSGEHAVHPRGKLLVELRALNHRFLDVRVRASRELAELTTHAELAVRGHFARGRIEIVIRGEGLDTAAPVLDVDAARSAFRQLGALRDDIAPGEPVPLALLAAVPNLFAAKDPPGAGLVDSLTRAFDAAARDLDAMREREGAALERDLREHVKRAVVQLRAIEARGPDALAA